MVEAARARGGTLVLGRILRGPRSRERSVEVGRAMGRPLVMRLDLDQQPSGAAHPWRRDLSGSPTPIVDRGAHHLDVTGRLVGARPPCASTASAPSRRDDAARQNDGHLHAAFDAGASGRHEAGGTRRAGPDDERGRPRRGGGGGAQGIRLHRRGPIRRRAARGGAVELRRHRPAHRDLGAAHPPSRGGPPAPRPRAPRRDRPDAGRAGHPGSARPRAGARPARDPRGSRISAGRWRPR